MRISHSLPVFMLLLAAACSREAPRVSGAPAQPERPLEVLEDLELCEEVVDLQRTLGEQGIAVTPADPPAVRGAAHERFELDRMSPRLARLGLDRVGPTRLLLDVVDGRVAAVTVRVEDDGEDSLALFDDLVVRWGQEFSLPDLEERRITQDGALWQTAIWRGPRQDRITLDRAVVELTMECAELAAPEPSVGEEEPW